MANLKSAAKRARQSPKKQATNMKTKNSVRTFEKKLRVAIAAKDMTTSQTLLKDVASKLDKAATKGVIHRKTAARKVSRLATQVKSLQA